MTKNCYCLIITLLLDDHITLVSVNGEMIKVTVGDEKEDTNKVEGWTRDKKITKFVYLR